MRPIAIVLISLLTFCQCKRSDEIMNAYVAGRLISKNPYEPNAVWKPVAKGLVKIAAHPSDTLNYITTVTTDNEGYFVFGNLQKDKDYLLFYSDSIDHLLYSGAIKKHTNLDSARLEVLPDTVMQNGFQIKIANAAGDPPAKGSICIFRNAADWATDTCAHSLKSLPVDETGIITDYNIPPGRYYFIGSGMIGGNYNKGKTFVDVGVNKIAIGSIPLVPVPPTGFELTVYDPFKRLVSDAEICVFRSLTQLLLDKCDNNIFKLESDSIGIARRINLAVGKYYLRVTGPSGTDLKKLDSVVVTNNTIQPKDIDLQK
jgi:hypothetical protein